MPLEVALLETAEPPAYQRIASRARQLARLGMSHVQIAKILNVNDKTVAKAVAWRADRLKARQSPRDAECSSERR